MGESHKPFSEVPKTIGQKRPLILRKGSINGMRQGEHRDCNAKMPSANPEQNVPASSEHTQKSPGQNGACPAIIVTQETDNKYTGRSSMCSQDEHSIEEQKPREQSGYKDIRI